MDNLMALIDMLLSEMPQYCESALRFKSDPRRLLRSLMNVRPPLPASEAFLHLQDALLQEELAAKGVTSLRDLRPIEDGMFLWRGDITTLAVDAIVNAANSALLGCFIPCHRCIDNAIHSAAGVQLRLACHELMVRQDHAEPTGSAKLTPGFNLPCRAVLHTVGPIVQGDAPTREDCAALASCYRSCLELALQNDLHSVAFCCISTGEFHFPHEAAAQIAVRTVREFLREHPGQMEVVFNVFQQADEQIYRRLLTGA